MLVGYKNRRTQFATTAIVHLNFVEAYVYENPQTLLRAVWGTPTTSFLKKAPLKTAKTLIKLIIKQSPDIIFTVLCKHNPT